MSGYEILSLDELDRYPSSDGDLTLLPLRRRLGFRPFGANVWLGAEPGDQVIERHREPDGVEELYVVVRGAARFTLGEETFDAPAGTLVHAPSGTLREAVAAERDTLVLAVGAKPGEAYEPSPWEDFFVAYAELRGGDAAAGRALIADTLARHPDAWQGQYNAACFESLAGDADAALAHLARALALSPADVKRHAAGDDDLASLRDDPRFQELVR